MNPVAAIKTHWIACTGALLITITCLSLFPLPEFPDMPGNDKSGHLIAYAALMFPAALRRPKYWMLYGLLFIVFSGILELIQPFANRYGEWFDLAANSAGILIGALIGHSIDFIFFGTRP